MKTVLKILGAIVDAWNAYQTLRRNELRDNVNRNPDDEWMRQFNPDMRRRETDAKQSESDTGGDHNGPK